MNQAKDCWQDLVISVLSVNNYSLEKTYNFFEAFEAVGLFDPNRLGVWSAATIAKELRRAGFNRGDFMTNLFASRLAALGKFILQEDIEQCAAILSRGDKHSISDLLLRVRGVGPKVVANYLLLRGVK